MTDNVTHHSFTMPTDGVGEKPSFTPEQIEEHNITPEELEAVGQTPEPEPEKILGKFNSQEDLEKAYVELEKNYHAEKKTETADNTPSSADSQQSNEDGDGSDEGSEADQDSGEAPKQEGNPLGEAVRALQEAGELTEDVLKQFNEAGIPEEVVNRFAELEQFKANTELKSITDSVGGEEAYSKMIDWAKANLSESEIDTFDNIVENGTLEEMRFAVTNLNARMSNVSHQRNPNLVKADAVATSTEGYPTQAHMLSDMNDPRYQSDPSFRDKVMLKATKSKW